MSACTRCGREPDTTSESVWRDGWLCWQCATALGLIDQDGRVRRCVRTYPAPAESIPEGEG